VAAQVAAHAATPVVVLRSDEPRYTDPAEFTGLPVVVGVDGSEESMRAFWFAADQADARSAQLQAVLVWSVPDITDAALFAPDNAAAVEDTATRLLAEATAGLPQRYPDLPIVRRIIEDRDAISGLCGAARSAGLLVVGSRGNGGFLGLRLGSTVDGLVRNTPAPLAVIRGAAGGK
jgi:nucleotide-binding universal stress UspA family protein